MKHFTCIVGIYQHKCLGLGGMKFSIIYSFKILIYLLEVFTNVIHGLDEISTIHLEYKKVSGNGPKLFLIVQQNTKFPPLRLSSMQYEAKLNGFHYISKVAILFSF